MDFEAIKQELEEHRHGRGFRYSPALKKAICDYVSACNSRGRSVDDAGRDLGIGSSTLWRWRFRSTRKRSAFRHVSVVEKPTRPARETSSPVLVTPSGYRVEGLDVTGVAALLRELS